MSSLSVDSDLPVTRLPLATAVSRLIPGLALTVGVTLVSIVAADAEAALFGRDWLEPLVLAILIGTAVRSLWTPSRRWFAGIDFSAKTLLEVAVLLLGASVSAATLMHIGPALIGGIFIVVALAIAASYGAGRALGLSPHLATLVACGNSICGNSAIAAVAPTIGADGDDVAASIAYTAVLGVIVVLALPLLVPVLGLSQPQYGVLAGLTVYAVPQVLAATAPVGQLALHLGTLVKLVRVLTLGPVVVALSLLSHRRNEGAGACICPPRHLPLHRLVPWFIIGFLALAAAHSFNLLPSAVLPPAALTANGLTILSMAALGLGVDVRKVATAGLRVTAAATVSLLLIGSIGFALISLVGVH